MRVVVEVIDPVGVEQRGSPLDAVDLISLGQQEFGKVSAILSRNTGDERNFLGHYRKNS